MTKKKMPPYPSALFRVKSDGATQERKRKKAGWKPALRRGARQKCAKGTAVQERKTDKTEKTEKTEKNRGKSRRKEREKRTEKRTGLKTRHYRRKRKKEGGLPFALLRVKSPAPTQQFE